jgi:hypothetical protein
VHYWSNEKHESSQNLVLQSQSFDTTWTQYQLASSGGLTGSQSAPDGTTTAWLVTAGTLSPGAPFLNQALSGIASSTEYTASVYLKAGTASHGYITLRGQFSHLAWAEIDFASPLSPTTGGANFTSISATSTAVGSTGWYRLTLTCTTSAVASPKAYVGPSDGTDPGLYGEAVWNCAGETIYVWGYQLEERGSATAYNATTTSIHRAYAPTLKSVTTAGQPRFEYDPSTDGQSVAKGILIESQATNLLTNSADFGGSWQIDNLTRELAAIGPDGTLSAFAFREATNSNQKRLFRGYTAGGGNVTISVYAKLMGNTRRLVIREIGVTGQSAVFDLATSTKVSGNGSIESVGNGWHRCQLNFSSTSTGHVAGIYLIPADSDGVGYDTSAYAGDGYSGLLLAMPQAEDQSFASSYISTGTSGSTATRAAESLSVGLSDINQNPIGNAVSAVAEFDTNANDAQFRRVLVLKSGDTGLRIDPQVYSGTGYVYVANTSGGTTELTNKSGVGTGFHKVAIGLDGTTANASFDGANAATMSNADTASVQFDKLQIGSYSSSQLHLEGHIRNVSLYNVGLSATNVEALTS